MAGSHDAPELLGIDVQHVARGFVLVAHHRLGRLQVCQAGEAGAARDGEILLGFGPGVGEVRWSLSPAGDLREAAANLFRMLREADREKPAGIAVSPIPTRGLGEAINDRLKRAAGFVG